MKCHVPKLTNREMAAVRQECQKQFDELLTGFNRQAALQILYVLHTEYGFGQQRLEKFAERLKRVQDGLNEER